MRYTEDFLDPDIVGNIVNSCILEEMITMKLIGFVGSSRIGANTSILVEKALEGAKSAGADVGLINLTNLTIGGCRGCW